jgi:uncharacterized protein
MLRVDTRQLQQGPVETAGQLEPGDPVLEGLGLMLADPVEVSGELQETTGGDFLWRGRIRASVAGECRRCLIPVTQQLDEGLDVLFSADPELVDDPSVYALAPDATSVDVTMAVREELALRLSAFPLCRPDCQGLCAICGADLNAGPCLAHGSGMTD